MVDIDEILASAIRNAWLHADSPRSRSRYYVEIERARRVRAAIERNGLCLNYARPMPAAREASSTKLRPGADD